MRSIDVSGRGVLGRQGALGTEVLPVSSARFSILKQLDGNRTIEQLIDGFHRQHAPKRITRSELQQLLTRFHKDGLVISGARGQGIELC